MLHLPKQHRSVAPLLYRKSIYTAPGFEVTPDNWTILHEESRILIVGAGGLGCELLKNFALMGFSDIHVIDMDTIDVSNLNRQFLFRAKDCGEYKAKVAAEFVMKRCPWMSVKWHTCAIQDLTPSWYKQFDLVIAGLDNVEARQWLNSTLIDLVQFTPDGNVDFDTIIPLMDGGTEGFSGQARVILPLVTSCFECSLASLPTQKSFPTCTIRNIPRLPEHCIIYALKVEWPRLLSFTSPTEFVLADRNSENEDESAGAVELDKDNAEHMTWLYLTAQARAAQFNIAGVTYNLTMQVVKNIIPMIASTNAVVAAACANEAFKMRTLCSLRLDNYYLYMGSQPTGTHTETISYERNPMCPVCQMPTRISISANQTLQQLLDLLIKDMKFTRPSVSIGTRVLYIPILHNQYQMNLEQSLSTLFPTGSILIANDSGNVTRKVLITYDD